MSLDLESNTLFAILCISAVLTYKMSFMHTKKIGYLSLLQVFYLVLLPGFFYTIIFNEVIDILGRPLNPDNFFGDKTLTVLLMISLLYTYGGLAIHTLTKTLNEYFRPWHKGSEVYQVSEFFHLEFSHNLIYGGALLSGAFFALLDLNHVSPYGPETGITISVLNGVFVGIASATSLFLYQKKSWWELRLFFMAVWIAIVMAIIAVKPYVKELRQYPLMLMMLVALSILAFLNIAIYFRKAKGRLNPILRIPKSLLRLK